VLKFQLKLVLELLGGWWEEQHLV